jgi:hypothetical protein
MKPGDGSIDSQLFLEADLEHEQPDVIVVTADLATKGADNRHPLGVPVVSDS